MPWQLPSKSHPWRAWKGSSNKAFIKPAVVTLPKVPVSGTKPVKVFLEEIVSSWNEVEVITSAYGREGHYHLTELPQERIAAWLSGVLRRNYAS